MPRNKKTKKAAAPGKGKSKFDGLTFVVDKALAEKLREGTKLGAFVKAARALRQPFSRDAACPPGETAGVERMKVTGYFESCVRRGIFRAKGGKR